MGQQVNKAIQKLEQRVSELEREMEGIDARSGGGGGGGESFEIRTVESLPAIPSSGADLVIWTAVGAGDGNDAIWYATSEMTQWYQVGGPFTTLLGTPEA